MSDVALVVIAKAPVPGRSKTRLCPPCSPHQAAALAAAALADTLAAVAATPARRRVLALDGPAGPWLEPGFEVIPQAGSGLGERITNALLRVGGPALLVGMDTPQLSPELLGESLERLAQPNTDAVLGHAPDGGYWAIGMKRPDPAALEGVPMSSPSTGALQLERLRELGQRVGWLSPLRDVDTIEDAHAVAAECPSSRFAGTLRELRAGAAAPT